MGVIPDIVAVAAEVKPINWATIPEHGATGLAAGPIRATVMAVAGEELREKSADTAMPGNLGDVRAKAGHGAAGLRRPLVYGMPARGGGDRVEGDD